ncbi:MAG: alpha/beta fold hydrolase [Acidobacteria bacterium]|nr:MAG: alpha/beta fold hydrolase [Acidobacteriota bacterium]TDI45348.1 MAG: alpha/beta fold hydrolase [Acidobacteriota bacterium]
MNITLPLFRPFPLLRGTAAQTISGALLPGPARRSLPAGETFTVEVEPGERVLLERTAAPGPPRGRLVLFHGLGGSANSRYLRLTLLAAHVRGWEVARVNARGAGGHEHLARRLPHAGRWPDLAPILSADIWTPAALKTPLAAVGFSLGGSILLRHLGETGTSSGLDVAIAVNPPTDLTRSIIELEKPANRLYQAYYVRKLASGLRRMARLYPDLYKRPDPRRHRSVRAIDEDYIAPDAGYSSAYDYWVGASAIRAMEGVRTPTLVISSQDDPFVPADMLRRDIQGRPFLQLALVPRGGHMGYLEWSRGRLRFWAGDTAIEALEEHLRKTQIHLRRAVSVTG